MNFGANLNTWLSSNLQELVLAAISIGAVVFIMKREMSKLLGFAIVAIIAVGLVYNTTGAKEVMLNLFNKIVK